MEVFKFGYLIHKKNRFEKKGAITFQPDISFFFFFLRGVSGSAYAHHDYSPRLTGHPASTVASKAPGGDRHANKGLNPERKRNKSHN